MRSSARTTRCAQTAMTGSFLPRVPVHLGDRLRRRALFAVGVGVVAILIGWALRMVGAPVAQAAAVSERVVATE